MCKLYTCITGVKHAYCVNTGVTHTNLPHMYYICITYVIFASIHFSVVFNPINTLLLSHKIISSPCPQVTIHCLTFAVRPSRYCKVVTYILANSRPFFMFADPVGSLYNRIRFIVACIIPGHRILYM